MDPRKLFFDDRQKGYCVYCGGPDETRDHVPSKTFLDEPYPDNLAVVLSCDNCNNGFASDEEYLACLLDCVIVGSAEPTPQHRPRIRRKLTEKPSLAKLIDSARGDDQNGNVSWRPDDVRVTNVLVKLARGHLAFEEATPRHDSPGLVDFVSLITLPPDEAHELLGPRPVTGVWPEIGSRAFCRAAGATFSSPTDASGWIVVQPRRYRYRVRDTTVQMLLSEYLACTVLWE